jgi:nitrite reductase/ring-hydroxylating ferredoxin subunit
VLVTKIKGEFYAVANTDPYDGHTRLSKGKLFGNKLMSSNNGVAYNIKNGEVEYGPALDNIPIFKCLIKEGQLHVVVPKKPPVKIRPYLAQRDYADMRKIVIVGGGESALAAAETLRYLDYYVKLKFQCVILTFLGGDSHCDTSIGCSNQQKRAFKNSKVYEL